MPQLLYLTRANAHSGGMQQHSRDFWHACQQLYGAQALRLPLRGVGMGNALLQLLMHAHHATHVHCGDVVLSPLGLFLKNIFPHLHVSLTAHGLDVVYPRTMYQAMVRKCMHAFDRIVCISSATAHQVELRGADPKRIVVIPCGVWKQQVPDRPYIIKRRPELLTVGRLVERKGVAWFIHHVLPFLSRMKPDIHYTIIGDGPERKTIEDAIRASGMENHVTLLGETDDDLRESCYRHAALFVMPNVPVADDMEGFGLVCIEAAARGVPVIAANIDGIGDAVISGATGRFFRSEDPVDAASVILDMLENPLSHTEVQESAFLQYDWNALAQRYHHEVFQVC